MTIYKRRGVYWTKFMRDGVRHRRSLGVSRLSDANRLEATLKVRHAEGKLGIGQSEVPTLEAFSTDFLNYAAPRVKPASYMAYTKAVMSLCSLPELASARLDKINMQLVDRFVAMCNEKGQAVATINLRLRTLRRILHVAGERELITKVPRIHGLKGENQREAVISANDEIRLIDTVEHPTMKALLPFLIDTGLRISEACALTWDCVNNDAICVKEGKTKFARRVVPLTKRAVEVLNSLRRHDEASAGCAQGSSLARFDSGRGSGSEVGSSPTASSPVFTRHFGAISQVWATKHFREARIKLGLPEGLVLHSTRHTFCTRLGKAGASAFELQRLAGHGNIQISARYCHPDSEQLTRAIDRLNGGR